ncbi:MAG TPA: CDP-diacylglycerol--glycerol-3-phosphate 3-phosphatidyltransferase [Candidatus Anoxymicrobiaceae bacterium]
MEFLKKNLANIVTLLRVFMTPVFVVFMVLSNTNNAFMYAALAVFVFGAVTDWFDGQIARRMNIVSQFGIMVDPLADRLFIGATLITLYVMGFIPLLFMILILGRDLLMVAGYPFVKKIDASKVAVHWTGKVATATLFVALSMLILSPRPGTGFQAGFNGYSFTTWSSWQTWGLWVFMAGTVLSLLSGGIYVARVIQLLREEKEGNPGEAAPAESSA